jgi:uncharacterized membrane protein
MRNQKNESNHRVRFTGLGAAIGLVFGGLVGLLIDNPVVFAGGGMVLGIAVGAGLDQRNQG